MTKPAAVVFGRSSTGRIHATDADGPGRVALCGVPLAVGPGTVVASDLARLWRNPDLCARCAWSAYRASQRP